MSTTSRASRRALRAQNKVFSAIFACFAVVVAVLLPQNLFSHETLTTTVLYDREIARVLDKHCVMCHMENGPSFPLTTYEQTWLQGRKIRADVIARHMPPWAAVAGYGRFANDNSLTLRESQFIVSWVEGLGPRNAGTVFTNIADASGAPRTTAPPSHAMHIGHWQLGEPGLMLPLPARTIAPRQSDSVTRVVVDAGLTADRRVRAVEYMPGDRRVVRAAFLTVQETGQWIGSWTPWYGFVELPAGSAYRLPARSHIVAEIHYRGTSEPVEDVGTVGLFFADGPSPKLVSDIAIDAKRAASPNREVTRLRGETRIAADSYAVALRPEITSDVTSLEVSARRPDGGTDILLFAKEFPANWPTPYIFAEPVLLRRGTTLSVIAYASASSVAASRPAAARVTVSRY